MRLICLFFLLLASVAGNGGTPEPTLSFEGQAGYSQSVVVGFESGGRLEFVLPPGHHVMGSVFGVDGKTLHQGDLIAKKRTQIQEYEFATAKLRLERAQTMLGNLEKEYLRNRPLREKNVISEHAFLEIETQYRSAQLEVRDAEVQLMSAEAALDSCWIRAPFDGVIEEVFIAPGSSVLDGAPLLRLSMIDPIRITFQASPADRERLNRAEEILVYREGDKEPRKGWISGVSAHGGTVSCLVANPLSEPGGANFFDDVSQALHLSGRENRNTLYVPSEITDEWRDVSLTGRAGIWISWGAVKKDKEGAFVWRVDGENGKNRLTKVRISLTPQVIFYGNSLLIGLAPDTVLAAGDRLAAAVPEGFESGGEAVYQRRDHRFHAGDKVRVEIRLKK